MTINLFEFFQEADQRDRLNCFSETHLIGQDSINSCLVEADHPVEAV